MAYSEQAADLLRNELNRLNIDAEEKKMFGGIAFMVNDAMTVGVVKDDIMVRVNPEEEQTLLNHRGVRQMDFTGKPMKGYLYLNEEGYSNNVLLTEVMQKVFEYNKITSARKKKKSK